MKQAETWIAESDAFGKALVEMADRYPKMVVFDADVSRLDADDRLQRTAFPDRFYEMGIAEANMVGAAAAAWRCAASRRGCRPSPCSWPSAPSIRCASRSRTPTLPVKLNASIRRPADSGRAGATHSSVEDIWR